jgi:hypothetical protein
LEIEPSKVMHLTDPADKSSRQGAVSASLSPDQGGALTLQSGQSGAVR